MNVPAGENKVAKQSPLYSRDTHPEDTIIKVGNALIGGGNFTLIAGPCAIEDEQLLIETAQKVRDGGAHILRGGAFKPRSSPYSFQGLGIQGIKLLEQARKASGLPIITEIMDPNAAEMLDEHVDIIQVGARNCQNFTLLKRVGQCKKPILLKRGMMNTLQELLMSAEYIMSEGNHNVILCERGIRTFETATRNTLDLSAVPVLKAQTHLPIIIDPSHAVGHSQYVAVMARAALAVGADGVMVEVHGRPEDAWCDGDQSLTPQQFSEMVDQLRPIADIIGMKM